MTAPKTIVTEDLARCPWWCSFRVRGTHDLPRPDGARGVAFGHPEPGADTNLVPRGRPELTDPEVRSPGSRSAVRG